VVFDHFAIRYCNVYNDVKTSRKNIMDFVAIDVETANSSRASICQIGVAKYVDGKLTGEWVTYVDPETEFDGMNISIHGIDDSTVKGSPKYLDVWSELYSYLDNSIVVSHMPFDQQAISQTADRYRIRPPESTWLDSAKIARRAWSEFAKRGYGLSNVCKTLGYKFEHHDALADAKAAGHIVISAIRHSGTDLSGWLDLVNGPVGARVGYQSLNRSGNSQGIRAGEVLTFTGALRMPRREAADLADYVGCQVASNVTKKTTIVVVGDQDLDKLGGHDKSSKHRKAEDLIAKGAEIRILGESDFLEMVRQSRK
jgi:DNA polymerase III subunit epsilon